MAEEIILRDIEDEMKVSYLTYAMSVIISRALPDVRDGLKPVHRRILFSMHKTGLTFNQKYKKCAAIVGDVLAKYHPHGDLAVYDALVRMAQDFSLRHPLVDGQGNFGSIDGDPAAAYRYTECRMDKLAGEILKDIKKETVDFQSNYDDTQKEPVVLPCAFPNLLVNGVNGIAVGMATSIPPHNLIEVIAAVNYYIDNNDCTVRDLMQYIKGPDFPGGGTVYGLEGVKKGYETGRGNFKVRAKVQIEAFKKDREAIVFTEIPYQVNKAEMVKKIAELMKNEIINGISEVRDESGRDGIRVVIELKKGVNTKTILNQLYKYTPLENSYSINTLAIVNNAPRTLTLKECIVHFVNHRFEVTTRRIQFDLAEAEARAHILEGLIKAVENIDEVVAIIRSSKNVDDARTRLITRFTLSEKQAQAILDMRLSRLTALEVQKLKEEYDALMVAIAEYKDLLANPPKIYKLIQGELIEISATYGNERRSEIVVDYLEELEEEAYIQKSNVVISLTTTGYIKRIPADTYRRQGRGGVGVSGVSAINDDDVVSLLFVATTHEIVMFITNKGKAYYLKAHEIPEASRTAKGSHVKMLLSLDSGEEIQGYLTFESFEEAKNFVMVTAQGVIKKCDIKDLINAKKRGVQAIGLKGSDTVVGAVEVNKGEDIMITTRKGLGLRTSEESIRCMGRAASGVRGMNLSSDDEIVGVELIREGYDLLVVSENGYGKKIAFSEFSSKGRGGKGQIYMKVSDKTGEIAAIKSVGKGDGVLFITSSGKILRLNSDDINLYGRPAMGTRLVSVKEPDIVVDAAVIKPIEAEQE